MNERLREAIVTPARERALLYPSDVERAVAQGASRYRLRLFRVYAVFLAALLVVAASLFVVHPATGIFGADDVKSITLEPTESTLFIDDSVTLVATAQPGGSVIEDGASIRWSSSDDIVASVEDGKVTAEAIGVATITAEAFGASDDVTVTVLEPPRAILTTITLSPPSLDLAISDRRVLKATGSYDDGTKLDLSASATWSSSAPAIAAVTDFGQVHALAPGTAVIHANRDGVDGSASVTIAVTEAELTGIYIDPGEIQIVPSEPRQLTLIGQFSDESTRPLSEDIVWSSDNPEAVRVTDTGTVEALAWDVSATISATVQGFTTSAVVGVPPAPLESITVTPSDSTISQTGEVRLAATGNYKDNTSRPLTSVEWSSSDTEIAVVDQAGLVSAATDFGAVTIEARSGDVIGTATVEVKYQVE